jgi:hypothetical protein
MLKPTPVSFAKCLKNLFIEMWPKTTPRAKTVEDCVPTLPPMSIIKGMNIATAALDINASSKPPMTSPARNPAARVMTRKGRRTFHIFHILPLTRTSLRSNSEPDTLARPAWLKMSSVVSSSMMSIASSTVMIPTMRFSLSTTGIESKSSFCNSLAASSWSLSVDTLVKLVCIIVSIFVSMSAKNKSRSVTTPSSFLV